MRFVNRTQRTVFVLMFDHDDALYQFNLPLPVARDARKLFPMQEEPDFNHPKHPHFRLGIAEVGRVDPNIPGDLLLWTDKLFFNSSQLALVDSGGRLEISDLTAPVPDSDPRRATPDQLNAVKPRKNDYAGLHIGLGKALVSDTAGRHPKSALPLQGWSISKQKSQSVERDNDLYARAFVIENPGQAPGTPHMERLVLVVCDIWSCSIAVKTEVASFTHGNVWISGTHTHSGPGGYLHHTLYNATNGGFDAHVFECVVRGIIAAIEDAVLDIGPGAVSFVKGDLPGLGRNRSRASYERNPASERQREDRFDGTDPEMMLLRFHKGYPGKETPAGALSWFALHTTCRGQATTAINGDHKGFAAKLLEEKMQNSQQAKNFIAAFANAHAGDVSGNFVKGSDPRKFDPPLSSDPSAMSAHKKRMEAVGWAQYEKALELYGIKQAMPLLGPLDWHHRFVDMARATGTVAALGVSFAAGSTEDGDSEVELSKSKGDKVEEGTFLVNAGDYFTTNKPSFGATLNAISSGVGLAWDTFTALVSNFAKLNFKTFFESILADATHHRNAHFPKPILLMPGNFNNEFNLVPSVVPLQILRIGPFALTGIPGEVTVMAGARIRAAILRSLRQVEHVALGTYANGYMQYITTPQEYAQQDYEGASNLFGPTTLNVMRTQFELLALEMTKGAKSQSPVVPKDLTAFVAAWTSKRRLTVRNLSPDAITFWVFAPNEQRLIEDNAFRFPGPGSSNYASITILSGDDVAVTLDGVLGVLDRDVQIVFAASGKDLTSGTPIYCWCRSLVVIDSAGHALVTSNYIPAARRAA